MKHTNVTNAMVQSIKKRKGRSYTHNSRYRGEFNGVRGGVRGSKTMRVSTERDSVGSISKNACQIFISIRFVESGEDRGHLRRTKDRTVDAQKNILLGEEDF